MHLGGAQWRRFARGAAHCYLYGMDIRSLDDLAAAAYNPRRISDEAASGLRASVQRFGDVSGIVFNRRTGHLVSGHQRVEQLRSLGASVVSDEGHTWVEHNGERFLIRTVDWDPSTETAANITANNPHIAGEFTDGLQPLLDELADNMTVEEMGELRLDELPAKISSETSMPDEAPPEEPSDSLAAIEIRCDRRFLEIAESAVAGLRKDGRFEINIS